MESNKHNDNSSDDRTTIEEIGEKLDKLFAGAIDVHDTLWHSKTETLRDAILNLIELETSARDTQTVAVVESCITYLQEHHPYPPNMKIDRTAFAGSRVAYSAAIYHLEQFMAELTEEIELTELEKEE